MANPTGNHQEASSSSFNGHVAAAAGAGGGGNQSNGNSTGAAAPESSASAMKHNPGISLDWTSEEQAILDDGLAKFPSESNIIRYAKIAMLLQNKTVRDVALRCRWMTERVNDPSAKPSHFAARPSVPPYAPPMIPVDNDDGISFKAIGGPTGELLEQNAQALNQISANLQALQIPENINLLCQTRDLLCQTRDNIHKIMNDLNDTPEVMKQMPPLPVKLNEELANSILPPPNLSMQS
ncbi:uncharacterized protein LOC126701659 isoform X3 [Quercus robur]|uniref:uncharacterized protein LOC115963980 isoform X3 n=1 Tax=Quercus lobata TaxID=97700 RepID=UPI00124583DC|nr:uncharacterized protein LOC115963980 isoform X3 [Quercus lobata]XP_050255914.1 uncharacterized protein LOC126701659 isoform X3 [Quercus robur]